MTKPNGSYELSIILSILAGMALEGKHDSSYWSEFLVKVFKGFELCMEARKWDLRPGEAPEPLLITCNFIDSGTKAFYANRSLLVRKRITLAFIDELLRLEIALDPERELLENFKKAIRTPITKTT